MSVASKVDLESEMKSQADVLSKGGSQPDLSRVQPPIGGMQGGQPGMPGMGGGLYGSNLNPYGAMFGGSNFQPLGTQMDNEQRKQCYLHNQ